MKATIAPCPCGCKKFVVRPLFFNVESSMDKEDAEELARRWNAFEPEESEALVTLEEAKAILEKSDGYQDFQNREWIVLDGAYSVEEIEAILTVAQQLPDVPQTPQG